MRGHGQLREKRGCDFPGRGDAGSCLYLYSRDAFQLYIRPAAEVAEEQQDLAREKLDSFLAAEFPRDQSQRVLMAGNAATQITHLARTKRFDLIIMPTHAGFFRRTLLGSTTAKVLNDAECPVMTTQHAETLSRRPLEHRERVCAVGLDADSARVLHYASQVTEAAEANLTVVHVISAGGPDAVVQSDLEERLWTAQREAAKRRIGELQGAVGSRAAVSVLVGPVKDMLTREATKLQADVLLIGRSPQSGTLGRLRDLTYAVVRDAPCPVLSV